MKPSLNYKKNILYIGILLISLVLKNYMVKLFVYHLEQNLFLLNLSLDFLLFIIVIGFNFCYRNQQLKKCVLDTNSSITSTLEEVIQTDDYSTTGIQKSTLSFGYISIMELDWKTKTIYPLNHSLLHLNITKEQYAIPQALIESEILHPDSVPVFWDLIHKMERKEKSGSCVLQLKDIADNYRAYQVQYHMIYNSRGIPIKALVFLEDMQDYEKENSAAQNHPLSSNEVLSYCNINLSRDNIEQCHGYWINATDNALQPLPQNKYSEVYKAVLQNFIWSEDFEEMLAYTNYDFLLQHHKKGHQWMQFSHRLKNKKDSFVWVMTTFYFMTDLVSGDKFVFIYHQNISEQQVFPAQPRITKDYFQKFLVASTTGYLDTNITQNYIDFCDGEWKDIIDSLELKKTAGDYDRVLVEIVNLHIPEEHMQMYYSTLSRDNLLSAFDRGENELHFEHQWKQADGSLLWFLVSIYLFQEDTTQDIHGLICMKNIDEEKIAQLELQNKAERDSLTQLFNRCTFENSIEALLEKMPYEQHALFIIDVDNFKMINDTFGHQYGDQVLKEIAETINATFHKDDMKGRIGGDEFTVCMQNVLSLQVVLQKARQLSDALCIKRRKNHLEYVSSVSIGIALYPQHGSNYFTLFEKADNALYTAKQSGKNQFSIFQYEDYTPEWNENIPISSNKNYKEWILDEIDDLVYISDLETYELLYMNQACQKFYLGNTHSYYHGQKCYRVLYGKEKPCEFCSNFYLIQNTSYVWEQYQPHTNQHFLVKDRLIQWDNRVARIEFAMDVTNIVQGKKNLL